MAVYDRVKFTTATTGTGTVTVGSAVTGFRTPATASIPNATTVSYAIEDGAAWEVGTGTYTTAGTTLSRTLVASSTGALLNLSGSAVVYITLLAQDVNALAPLASPSFTGGSISVAGTTNAFVTLTPTYGAGVSIIDFSGSGSSAQNARISSGVGSATNIVFYTGGGSLTERARIEDAAFKLSVPMQVSGTQVVNTRRTGWTAWTGTATRTTIATGSATTQNLAEALKALLDDLIAHGLIGT